MELQEVQWLWHPYIPFGKLTIIQGNPGEGKTTLALRLAAACSTGTPLPGMEPVAPFPVIYQSAEEGNLPPDGKRGQEKHRQHRHKEGREILVLVSAVMKIATLQYLSQHPCIVAFFFLPQPTRTAVPTVAPPSAVCGRFRGGLGKVPHPHQKSRTTAPCRRSPGTAESRK